MNEEHRLVPASLSRIEVAHGASAAQSEDGIIFAEDTSTDWHLLVYYDERLRGRHVTLRIVYRPFPEADSALYINHNGGIDVAVIPGPHTPGIESYDDNGWKVVTLSYVSTAPMIYIGGYKHGPRYVGSGKEQFLFRSISFRCDNFPAIPREDRVVLLDVGAAGGISNEWHQVLDKLDVVLVEPIPEEASKVRELVEGYPSGSVLMAALSNVTESKRLFLTRFPQCSSLLEPDRAALAKYSVSPLFDVVSTAIVPCHRFDDLQGQGLAPIPDVVKIDVQGAEHLVLDGFGEVLRSVIALEIEGHFYPIYNGEKPIGEMVLWLRGQGLYLRSLLPVPTFDGDLVEVNARFTRESATLSEAQRRKLALVERVWDLKYYPHGREWADKFSGKQL